MPRTEMPTGSPVVRTPVAQAPDGGQAAARVMLVGLPNTGKSTAWNRLTGRYNLVANYPLTTLEVRSATAAISGVEWTIVDTPGIHGLFVQSEEDAVVRRELLRDPPAVLVLCVDAHALKQSLALAADLAGIGLPLVVLVCSTEEARANGTVVDLAGLERSLGCPVVESPAPGRGIDALRAALARARPAGVSVSLGIRQEEAIDRVEALLPERLPFRRKIAELLMLRDERILADLAGVAPGWDPGPARVAVEEAAAGLPESLARTAATCRDRWVDDIVDKVVRHRGAQGAAFAETFGRLSRHPVWGLPILAVFLAVTYFAVVHLAGWIASGLAALVTDPAVRLLSRIIPAGFWADLLIGDYGLLTLGLFNAICTVLPILSVFFLLFALVEDSGYLPNITVLSRRLFAKVGLTGSSIIPLVLGFGCKTMATLTARNLRSRKERLIVVYLIAFAIPCSAQLGLNMAILGSFGPIAFAAAVAFLALVEVLAGVVLNLILPGDEAGEYLQELPPIRVPSLRGVAGKTGHRLLSFLREALPVFLVAAAVLFTADRVGLLGALKSALRPVITGWLGLPVDTVDALILSMARHEAAAGLLLRMVSTGALNASQAVVAVSITTMFVPCIANIVSMFRVLGWKAGLTETLAINVSAFALAGVLNHFLLLVGGIR
ncbi:MAG: ferrous iron transporter B [Spirochaetes bacterium]|nr:ferrous iron transporter B [Spirochaetota bacterium]